jgi:regulatory protein
MSPRITRIEDAGPGRKARRLFLDDGSEPRTTSAVAVKRLGLTEGAEFSASTLDRALSQIEPDMAKERAIQLLGYRERSTSELLQGIRDSGYDHTVANAIVERFAEIGLVDDERFAGMWVRTRVAAGLGARRIARELADKGIAPAVIDGAVQQYCAPDDELERAVRSLRGRRAADRRERDRLIRKLAARGYDLTVAVRAVDASTDDQDADYSP